MDPARIGALLQPFLTSPIPGDLSFRTARRREKPAVLTPTQLGHISTYLDLLLRWNSRINLTAIREPEEIVTRHFGESLFAARCLFQLPDRTSPNWKPNDQQPTTNDSLVDFGSGAGFPGLPVKIWVPHVELTLIESNQKKATFLREVIRTLALGSAKVFSGRAEDFHRQAHVVTLRAVERFERSLAVATSLVAPGERLALLIGGSQVLRAQTREPNLQWQAPIPIPLSSNRMLLIGIKNAETRESR